MGFIDLHVHSNLSDGSCSPAELVQLALEKGLSAFALTDHDSVAGIAPAISAARNYPLEVIPGIEITSSFGRQEIHILGYYIDYENPRLLEMNRQISQIRDDRNIKICAQLRSYGVDINYEDFRSTAGCRMITRRHFAAYLVAGGYASDLRDAFEKYLIKGRPCYIPMRKLSTEAAVRLILASGGVPVVAHPVLLHLTEEGYLKFFTLMKSFGVRGIEAIYSSNTAEDEQRFRSLAKELGMFITGGSDFHGVLKPGVDIGTGRGNLMIPQSLLDNIR
ncbi:MAG: PHP domain-containing protein [Parasporobacterium sp.]|nr:PHP domain-containing protein [Parasporobacterium sp.]